MAQQLLDPACTSDVTGDGLVGVDDMLQLLASYATTGCSTTAPGCPSTDSPGAIYISSFNQFCGGSLPAGTTDELRAQSKCWICEDTIRAYINGMAAGTPYLPPAGTNFSPDPSVTFTLGYDFFIYGYDNAGYYQGNPAWNDAGLGGWPPAYTGDCNTGFTEDMTACQASVGGTYTIPAQTCMDLCGVAASCPDNADGTPASCRSYYTVHEDGLTTFYSEKIEHQYELTEKATAGAYFHGYFLDAYGLLGETVYTQPDSAGGFMSCSFTDFPWETANAGGAAAAEAQATAAASIYISSFNQFCSGSVPSGTVALREQSKCWICEDTIRAYVNGMAAGNAYLPPAGTNFSPDPAVNFTLGYDFFIYGYDSTGYYQGDVGWNDAAIGGWPPAYTGDCNTGFNEDMTACQASVGGTYTIPAQNCMEACGVAASCPDNADGTPVSCRSYYTVHEDGRTTFYSEKVEHQYELSAKATMGAFFHGYFLDAFGLAGETVYTQPTPGGGFMSCSFSDYAWESSTDVGGMLTSMQSDLATLVAAGR